MSTKRKTVFISYAHQDRRWVDELLTFMAPWIRDDRVQLWDDSQIDPGADWEKEIEQALREATVAVLFVTANFLSSKFILERELPVLLQKAEKGALRLMWIAAGYSSFRNTELAKFQAVNDPRRPLEGLNRAQRNKAMVDIAQSVADAATIGTLAGGLQIIDATTEPLEAALAKRTEEVDRTFGVKAEYHPQSDKITFRGASQTITVFDLQHLPDDDREFIADLEDSLKRNYDRWRNVRKTLGDAGGALDEEVNNQLKRIATLMCRDLNNILDFLRKMHKGELEDHYGRYRFICDQLRQA